MCNPIINIVAPDEQKEHHGTSGDTIYNRVTQCHHRVTQFFIGLCNFSTRLQIPRVTIWNNEIHSYRRGPAWSVIYFFFNYSPFHNFFPFPSSVHYTGKRHGIIQRAAYKYIFWLNYYFSYRPFHKTYPIYAYDTIFLVYLLFFVFYIRT